jgi:hypothetical protein
MRYVENEGVLFVCEGPSNAFPVRVWSRQAGKFVAYEGDVPKPNGWGEEISEEEAKKMMIKDD